MSQGSRVLCRYNQMLTTRKYYLLCNEFSMFLGETLGDIESVLLHFVWLQDNIRH